MITFRRSTTLGEGARLTGALIAEHGTMRAMIRDLAAEPAARLDERLTAFGELLRAHIHTEERVLFEQMQTACDPEVLETLGARIADAAAVAPGCRR